MRLAWYGSRLFWGGLLGLACLLFVWGYKLEAPTVYRAGWTDAEFGVGVGEGRVWGNVEVRVDRADPFSMLLSGVEVEERAAYFARKKGWVAPAMEGWFYPQFGNGKVVIGHWLLVIVYMMVWIGVLVWWQRRKQRLAEPVPGRMGWKTIAMAVVGMASVAAMAVAMTRREERPPVLWDQAFRGHGRAIWKTLNKDGVVMPEEIIEFCYREGSHHDGDRMLSTALALAGQEDDPIPALRKMMGDALPERRAFAALTAGYLGDVRLRRDVEKLRDDKATLPHWFWDTVGDVAEEALKSMGRRGVGSIAADVRGGFGGWLELGEIRE